MKLDNLFPVNLSEDEEKQLLNYTGQKLTVSDGRGNVIESVDTRELSLERLKARKDLKIYTRDNLLKEFPLNKQLNFNDLPEEEQVIYTDIKTKYLAQYEDIKSAIENSTTVDEIESALGKFK